MSNWNFDLFRLADVYARALPSPRPPLPFVGFAVFRRLGLLNQLPCHHSVLWNCLHAFSGACLARTLQSKITHKTARPGGYRENNPFHNSLHGSDVAHALSCLLVECRLRPSLCFFHS